MSSSDPVPNPDGGRSRSGPPRPARRRILMAAALVAALGAGAGVTAVALHGRQVTLVALAPAPINAMRDWSPVALKGQVAEIFGNKFIVQDDSGRALVETGPAGEGGRLVAKAEIVTVQGRFEHGFVHAVAIAHDDGRTDLVGPPGPPPGGPLSWRNAGHVLTRWFSWRAG